MVNVPVLSRQKTCTEPSVSTASRCLTATLRDRISLMPIASVVVATAGRPSGTAATASETDDFSISSSGKPLTSPTANTPAHTAPLSSASCVPILSSCLCIGVSGDSASPTMVCIWPSSVALAVPTTTPVPLPPETWVPM